MKIEIQSKKGLTTTLSIIVDKKDIQNKLEERLLKLQSEISLNGFRKGKVPPSVIKSQYGKAIYGEVIDKILQESSSQAIKDKKIKVIGQPKIDLKTFGEGKDLNYEMQVNSLPEIKLQSFENYKATDYEIKIEDKIINEKIKELANQYKNFEDKDINEKAEIGNQVTFDYTATVDGNKFEGSEGKGVSIELGKDLFLNGFDKQLVGIKKNESKMIEATLPENHPKKELANKNTKFLCKILNVKKAKETKLDDKFAKNLGAKDFSDMKKLIEKQISSQYKQALNSITKKEILDQIEKKHELEIPKNLIENELIAMTQNLKKEDSQIHFKENERIAKSRIKLGLILNEYGEKNNLKVNEQEINAEIQKQIKNAPGQEKMVMDYYQKNQNAVQSLKGALYEEKILDLFKSKIKLSKKIILPTEAEKILSDFNKATAKIKTVKESKSKAKSVSKTKKISKK